MVINASGIAHGCNRCVHNRKAMILCVNVMLQTYFILREYTGYITCFSESYRLFVRVFFSLKKRNSFGEQSIIFSLEYSTQSVLINTSFCCQMHILTNRYNYRNRTANVYYLKLWRVTSEKLIA